MTLTALIRWDDYLLGLDYIASNPIIGAGMDQSGTGTFDNNQMVTLLAIHNTILQSWVTGGLLTFFGTILVYFHVIKYSLGTLNKAIKTKTFSIMVGLSASSLGFAFMDMTSSNIYQRVKWIIFAILLGLISCKEPLSNEANPDQEETSHDLLY